MRALYIFGLALVAAGSSARAQSYNTYTDFSATNNPNGVWTYGWTTTLNGSFVVFDQAYQVTPAMPGWRPHTMNSPLVAQNPTAEVQGVVGTAIAVPPHSTWFHPGLANGEFAVYRLTAPHAGTYSVSAIFQKIDLGNSFTTRGYILINGAVLLSAVVPVNGAPLIADPVPVELATGDHVDFVLGPESSSAGGATLINGNVSGSGGCPADWNHSGAVNSQDFFDFLSDFFAGHADFNNSGSTDSQDFFDFLTAFFAGC